ncbi:GBP domain containing protein, partial [Asbolus verrucosus]
MVTKLNPQIEQLFDLDEKKQIVLNKSALLNILLRDEIKDKHVCVISIAGAYREGKSFLMNFLLRYLHIRYKLKKRNVTNWLDPADGPISGFSWKIGSMRHTVGIVMWSEIFLAELPTGEEVAIILLDTQGSFDNSATITECATIFGLSTLISSVQIYNLKENIKQSDLSHLEVFSGYGRLFLGDSESSRSPFQSLVFLIRDWQWSHEKEFGAEGGEKLLNNVLKSDDTQPGELVRQKKNVKELFSELRCFLLPHPGQAVATNPNFQGELQDVDAEFRKHIQVFAPYILAPENLVPKKINGEMIKVVDLVNLIEGYWKCLQDGRMPSLQTIFSVAANVQHMVVLHQSENIYDEKMRFIQEDDSKVLDKYTLIKEHIASKSAAMKHYNEKRKLGDKLTNDEYEKTLDK